MNNWKEELQTRIDNCILYNWQGGFASKFLLEYIESLLEEQRKDLINQILSEAPEDMVNTKEETNVDWFYGTGFNQANQQWRELLTKHLI